MIIDLESLLKQFKSGDLDFFVKCIYAYFLVGYLIIFSIYEQDFLNLELSTQIFLSIGICYPIMFFNIIYYENFLTKYNKTEKTEMEANKFKNIYESAPLAAISSILYSIFFSLFYIIKQFATYENKYDPLIALAIILLPPLIYYLMTPKQ